MTTRKRKSPDRKKPVKQPGILPSLLMASGRTAARHPKPLLGVALFGVVFSFVAANALWYQPGDHPHPFLATRDAKDPNQIAGYRPMRRTPPGDVTTFRIERADPNASTARPAAALAPAAPQTASPQAAAPMPAAAPAQPQMAQPAAAPYAPVQPAGAQAASAQPQQPVTPSVALPTPRPQAGDAPRSVAAKPTQPMPAVQPKPSVARAGIEDPVAAAIRSADRTRYTPPADIPNTGSTPVRPAAIPVSQKPAASGTAGQATDLVLQIQRGLSNIAYADVRVDGVASDQTKAAIRRFQKHYRLPETGEPDVAVLKKLKSIGAL
ncbi:peptidoglycan-binding protein [Rhizobium sp. XQZ8]|uniref:peptidoglycan-binding domain-containing protein n=1 Tax=Rhizobium populisoli TaxID=2859785 RepID=UPI001C6688C8|nr:peptidoglycan-binding domain-containing protein [Rhizobium populisoli]MBW6421224.1 peptidoglycan-binding protein [Rhizobium populisoli]